MEATRSAVSMAMQTFRETLHVAAEKTIPAPDLSDSEALQSVAAR